MNQTIMYIVVTILVPLIPAYIIYRVLHSQTHATGKYMGLNIDLKGAFAGYFLLVLCIFGFITARQRAFTLYTVEGKIQLKSAQDLKAVSMGISPPTTEVLPTGDFVIRVPVENGSHELPRLLIECSGYDAVNINLAEDTVFHSVVNWKQNKIQVQTPIKMELANDAPYQPDGAVQTALQD